MSRTLREARGGSPASRPTSFFEVVRRRTAWRCHAEEVFAVRGRHRDAVAAARRRLPAGHRHVQAARRGRPGARPGQLRAGLRGDRDGGGHRAHKPDPDPILCALRRMGVSPETAIYVGDSPYDILAARAAGRRVRRRAVGPAPAGRPARAVARPTRSPRRRRWSPRDGDRARGRAARAGCTTPTTATHVLDDPTISDGEYDALLRELQRARGRASRAGHRRLADPARGRGGRRAGSPRCSTCSRCCRWPTPATRTSSRAWARARPQRCSAASPSSWSPSPRSTAWRSRCSTATACSCAARRGATASSART